MAIGTSIVASGLVNVGFVTIRLLDDTQADSSVVRMIRAQKEVQAAVRGNTDAIQSLRRTVSTLVPAAELRVFARHPTEEVMTAMESFQGHLDIDCIGFTLRSFCTDFVASLLARGDVRIRLIVQNPTGTVFKRAATQEHRNRAKTARDVLWVTRLVLRLNAGESVPDLEGAPRLSDGSSIEIRWSDDYPTITLNRVGHIILARPRFPREATGDAGVFYERYVLEEGQAYNAYKSFFDVAWMSARPPTSNDCDAADRELEKRPA